MALWAIFLFLFKIHFPSFGSVFEMRCKQCNELLNETFRFYV